MTLASSLICILLGPMDLFLLSLPSCNVDDVSLSGPANRPRKLKGQRADLTSEKKSSQGPSTLTFFLPFVIMCRAHWVASSHFPLAFLSVLRYWRISCHPSQSLLASSPVNLTPSEYVGVFSYFEIKGYMSVHVCLNNCISSVSSRKEIFSLFCIRSWRKALPPPHPLRLELLGSFHGSSTSPLASLIVR